MAYAGGAVTRDEKPGLATSKSYGSYNARECLCTKKIDGPLTREL
jgi:hypothetical protein